MLDAIETESWIESHERPFVLIDGSFRIKAVNRAFERAFAVEGARVVGRVCHETLHGSDAPCRGLGRDRPCHLVQDDGNGDPPRRGRYPASGGQAARAITVVPLRAADGTLYIGEILGEGEPAAHRRGAEKLVGGSPVFRDALEQLELAARAEAAVVLQGETGTGKELAARFVHRRSPRAGNPFLALDCTALSEALFESEVFGHERGAFTGSVARRRGLFELADGGTLFLDEITELSLEMQAKLLRVLERGEFRRVGGRETLTADVRIICATNRPLWDQVERGRFRADLYFRVACFCVRMPALRDRLEDVPELAEALLGRLRGQQAPPARLGSDEVDFLKGRAYPGNVRELRNVLETAIVYAGGGRLNRKILEQAVGNQDHNRRGAGPPPAGAWPAERGAPDGEAASMGAQQEAVAWRHTGASAKRAAETRHIEALLARFDGHRRSVAEQMGISERTLYRKLKRYGLS